MPEASLPEEMSGDRSVRELVGQIERITYHDEESGYTVLRIQVRGYPEQVTAVGTMSGPAVGSILQLKGGWRNHPRFGVQFDIKEYKAEIPTSAEGIEKYLASGIIKGIGPSVAEKIVDRFGRDTIQVLDNEPDKLLEVEGIGAKKAAAIKAAWAEQRDVRDVMLFLQNYGIGTGLAVRVFKHYGASAINVLQENPYRLAIDMFGIGFQTADKVAASMGFAKNSPFRIRAGILHVINEMTRDGHIYVPIDKLAEAASEILDVPAGDAEAGIEAARLAEEIIVEWFMPNGGGDECAVYLPAFHYAETHSAKNLYKLLSAPWTEQRVNADAMIPWVQDTLGITLAEKQEEALRTALESKVMVITGGPGTGKTTLIKAILKIREARGLRVMLAAPTGRAAKRMSEATGHEARTIHRMLEFVGLNGSGGDFLRDESNPLECDLLVVDEASMIDQILFHHLLKAIPANASVIFVGDVNQLPSVGAGNVLGDVISSGVIPVVRLNEIFRQARESMIVVNAHRVNNGEFPIVDSEGGDLKDFYFIQQDDPDKALEIIKTLVTERIPKRFGFDPVNDLQVLSPMHRGSVGTMRLNSELQQALNTGRGARAVRMGVTYQEGDKVMQIRNNYQKDVYNGDIGRIFKINGDEGLVMVQMDNGLVSYEFSELDELVHAYAVSIHKSQGSEYPAVVIPLLTQHYVMLQRNLLYTAITRGKQLVIIVGSKKAAALAVRNDKTRKRWTRLADRLRRMQRGA